MESKAIIIGIFVKKKKILSFLESLKYVFLINTDKVFIYEIDTNENEYLVTFKTFNKDLFMKNFENATVMHVKNGTLFSINALNKLIDSLKGNNNSKSNNEYLLDWSQYHNKLIIVTNGVLSISNLTKIDNISQFFKE
jgi:hypothetical protein